MPRVNLLIADDVGLGKTIEAGLVAQELILRHRARRILVVCPASLLIQWRDQMRDKFGLDFRIVDTALLRQLRRERGIHVNPWSHFPRLITSIDFLKRERPMRLMREALRASGQEYPRPFDLLIVDEAHNVAPAGIGRYALDSQRTQAVRALVPRFEHKLFLSATPHNGYQESFTALLEMLDNQRFARGVKPDERQLASVMVRRLKSELPKRWDGSDRFPRREIKTLEVNYTGEERHIHELLRRYSASRLGAGTPGAPLDANSAQRTAAEFVLKLLKKRLFSSPAAFAHTLERHIATVTSGRREQDDARDMIPPSVLRRYLEQVEEEFADEEAYAQATDDALQRSAAHLRPLSAGELALLHEMRDWATQASRTVDSKAKELIDWLRRELMPGGVWGSERVIIFTEYRDTQKWLFDALVSRGMAIGERVMLLYGGMETEERERVKAAFQADPAISPVCILLATDAASEGIDLQNHCSRLIHYEIPWNPNRMEQRNGRIDRHGQRAAEVRVYHFVPAGYREYTAIESAFSSPADSLEGDLEFLMRAARKVEQIREDLGTVGDVIARQVEEAMLGKRRILDTTTAERRAEPARRLLRLNRDLRERISRLHEKLQESRRDLRITPANIQAAVTIALELADQPPLRTVQINGVAAFEAPPLKGSWAACVEGLEHPHTHALRPIVFDPDLAQGRDDVVLAHLNSRLVQMALRLLRAEIGASVATRKLRRVTTRLIPNEALDAPAVIVHARLLMLGGDEQRLHEEILTAGGTLREGRFQRMNVGEVSRALAAALDEPASPAFQQQLIEQAAQHAGPLEAALQARMRERAESLDNFLKQRAEAERTMIQEVLSELQRNIQAELNHPEIQQLELFSNEEREQAKRDKSALERRLAEIPGEIRRETEAISLRYADPQPRVFPVAVTYLVPERLGRERARP
jgi:superfamily II DNA or RNA helicase